jgi:hypothetical protein
MYDYAAAYGFDGWMIDMEAGFYPTPAIVDAVRMLAGMLPPDGRPMRVVVYEAGAYQVNSYMLQMMQAGAEWQSDYVSSPGPLPYPGNSYQTLTSAAPPVNPLTADWASYVYAFQGSCAGDTTDGSQIWNGNRPAPPAAPQCLSTAGLFANQRSVVPASPPPGSYTSLGLYAPIWPYVGNLKDGVAPGRRG